MSKLLASALFAASLVAAPAVYAVDIQNQDGVDHEITVEMQSTISNAAIPGPLTLKAGELHKNLCLDETCRVEFNGVEMSVGGDTGLIIKDGKLQVAPKAPRG